MSDLFTYLYTPPSLDEMVEASDAAIPDPEGYVPGQEAYGYSKDAPEPDYDDCYEPDVCYDGF